MAKRSDPQKSAGRRRLGRGLGSLISAPVRVDIPESSTERSGPDSASGRTPPAGHDRPASALEHDGADRTAASAGVETIPVGDIRPNPRQPRQQFDDHSLATLAESIRTAGLMQPIVVRPGGADTFELIAGERRWRAAQLIGMERIPAVVREVDDHQAAEWSLIENIQREDLNPIERAEAFRRLIDEFGLTQQQLAERVGIDRSNVTNHLRLLELDSVVRDLVMQGLLNLGHARAVLGIINLKERQQLAARAVREGWSVRTVEQRVRRATASGDGGSSTEGPAEPATGRAAHLKDLERRLGEHLGTKVEVRPGSKQGTGRLVISFYDNDQFEGVLQRLGFDVG